ncbi:type III secretion system inner membrane ring subunit SctD [Thalassomonas viridans]|uniref:Type III secretion system inner membrane ring subunit SctD n=1 Tax=Thalassomonas viridans TaxID=137584 RepID=A0AAE9YWY0_9GAMM|nr:type III secretion system inner membrane ring subunit SctD [Thalassomonas viridans]WDE02801.1 type III secretion system inner membrane ring subunit SctD [Thalassomonas viridans]
MALASPQDKGLSASGIAYDEAAATAGDSPEQGQEQPAPKSGQFLAKWTLKVLSGVHLGAEIPLYHGSTRLGKAEDNDIVLSGDDLPDHLATLVCSGDEIFIEDLHDQQENYLAGQPLTLNKQALNKQAVKPFEVITLGLLHLVYGPRNEPWPEVELPKLQAQEPEPEPESGQTAPAAEAEQNEAAADEAQQSQGQTKAGVGKKRTPAVLAGALLAVTLGCGGVYLGFSSQVASEPAPLSQAEQRLQIRQNLQQALAAADLMHVSFSLNESKPLTLEGFVADNKQLEQVQQLVAGAGYPVKMNIRILSQLFNNLSYLLNVLGYPDLKVSYGEQAGDFVIGGYLADNSHWPALKTKLERDVAGVGHISANFDTLASRAAWLKTRLSEAGLDNLAVGKQAAAIVVRGEIAAGSLASWQQIEQEFNRRYLGLPKLEFAAQKIEKTIQEIKGVSLGAVPYIITTDGKRVITGGKLEGGYLIESIGPDRVVLSKAGKAMIYLIGGQHNE